LVLQITSTSITLPTEQDAANFTATWNYPQGSETQPVHAFPNAKLNVTSLPIQLSSLTSMDVGVAWNYAVGNAVSATTDTDALTNANLNANVCFDIFLSSDRSKSESTTDSGYEVMIWLGQFGPSTQPIGYPTVSDTFTIGDTTL
jgi:hypothetical protein